MWTCASSTSSSSSSLSTATIKSAWRMMMTLITLTLLTQASAQREAKVHSSQCSYTLVVNEFDASKCPVMQADDRNYPWQDSPESSSRRATPYTPNRPRYRPRASPTITSSPQLKPDQDVNVLRSQVKDLEGRLLEEMVRGRELNATLSRHGAALRQAERQLGSYATNFTSLYRAMVFVQRQLHRQRKVNKSLNKKLSNVLLDVVEVNNVLSRGSAESGAGSLAGFGGGGVGGGGGKASRKNFEVQSVANVRSCPGVTDQSTNFRDCAAVFEGGHRQSGVYYVKPTAAACPVPVWCDMDTQPGGWLLFQRRQDGSEDFKRDWAHYRDGFGNVAREHWLGNDNLFLLSNQDHYQLRVDLWDFSGNRVHAIYSTFRVAGPRDNYQLTVGGYTGSAQDSLYRHNKMAFSTPDRDHDGRREAHCAAEWEAGWWFNNCWFALLNGAYHNRSDVSYRGIAWNHWKREQLRKTEMKIRPASAANRDEN